MGTCFVTSGIKIKKINQWFTAPKGTTPVRGTSATDWQMAV